MLRILRISGLPAALAVALLVPPCEVLASPLHVAVRLLVIDQVGVQPSVLTRAQTEARRIYEALGVELQWVAVADSTPRFDFVVKIVGTSFSSEGVDDSALGIAPGTGTIRGTVAYAFYRRVGDFANVHGMDLGMTLGLTVAHELGHLLLPSGHARAGLMRASWGLNELSRAAQGRLLFTTKEALAIRRRLTSAPAMLVVTRVR